MLPMRAVSTTMEPEMCHPSNQGSIRTSLIVPTTIVLALLTMADLSVPIDKLTAPNVHNTTNSLVNVMMRLPARLWRSSIPIDRDLVKSFVDPQNTKVAAETPDEERDIHVIGRIAGGKRLVEKSRVPKLD